MIAAAQLRTQIETALADRIPAALTPSGHRVRELMSCGVEAIDEALHGGVPRGAITELIGRECTGRTSMALAYMAGVTQTENVGAWVDVADALDPEAVAANGVELERLLWVRCGGGPQTVVPVKRVERKQGFLAVAGGAASGRHTGGGSPHPRSEGRDMPNAIGALLRAHGGLYDHQRRKERRGIGTPGAPNRLVGARSEDREEQVNSDRLPARRGENLAPVMGPRCAEPQPRRVAQTDTYEPMQAAGRFASGGSKGKPWQALDQALRTTDLLLQSGGFRLIVLDLGSTAPEFAWRIPLATWFRFRAACERTLTSLVLLTQHPCARSSAELVVSLRPGDMVVDSRVMMGVRYRAEVERSRAPRGRVVMMRKPPHAERPGQWKSGAAWGLG